MVWFTLHKGKEQQCECGYYFKLMDHSPLDEGITPKFGKGFGSGMGKFKWTTVALYGNKYIIKDRKTLQYIL